MKKFDLNNDKIMIMMPAKEYTTAQALLSTLMKVAPNVIPPEILNTIKNFADGKNTKICGKAEQKGNTIFVD